MADLRDVSDDDWKALGFKMATRNWFRRKVAAGEADTTLPGPGGSAAPAAPLDT